MNELEFTSTLSNEEIEENFTDIGLFSEMITALEEVLANEKKVP